MLNSAKKEDKCLQCGGDGRACYEVKGTFDVLNLPKGTVVWIFWKGEQGRRTE